jgi:hypothetical protein
MLILLLLLLLSRRLLLSVLLPLQGIPLELL